MKRIFAVLAALLLLCAAAWAEESEFVQGGGAAKLADEYYMRVDEGETDALVRIDAAGTARIAVRADEIGDMAASDGVLYYLMRTGDTWALMGLSSGGAFTVYEFAAGAQAACVGARDGMLFVLVDNRLNILYPSQGLCLPLAGAAMAEYVIHDDFAYYISLDDVTLHRLADGEGNVAEYTAGSLCRVGLSTGRTDVLLTEGADDLQYADGALYFHNYLDRYLMGAGDSMSIEGYLYSYDIATGAVTKLTNSYDWDYALISGEVCVLRQDGFVRLSDGATLAMLPDSARICAAGDAAVCFDSEEMTFTVIK